MATQTSTPRKRQTLSSQSTITSFFTPNTNTNAGTNTTAPEIPPAIKSNLLNVGMRIRKSVPEGYKSGTYMFAVSKSSFPVPAAAKSAAKKREFEDDGVGMEKGMGMKEVLGGGRQIAVPRSQRRRYHAAIARESAGGDVVMLEEGEDFEEAEFLRAV